MRWLAVLLCTLPLLADPPRGGRLHIRIPAWAPTAEPLTATDFQAKIDGSEARVTGLQGPSDDMLLVVVFDVTGDLAQVQPAKQALVEAVRTLPLNVYVGLMRAQDGLRVLLDPTADREALAEAVASLPVSGRAGLLDTVETATRLSGAILDKAPVRFAFLYITDSDVRNYREDFTNPVINSSDSRDLSRRFPEGLVREKISKLTTTVSSQEAPLFIVHLDYRSDRLNEAYQSGLLQLASATGGTAAFCRSNLEIPAAIDRMVRTIGSHYVVDLEVPEGPSKNIQIQLASKDLNLSYRSRYVLK